MGYYIHDWNRHLKPLADGPPVRVLEIGIGSGRGMRWFLAHVVTRPVDQYVGIDPWDQYPAAARKWTRLIRNRRLRSPAKVTIITGRSQEVIPDPAYAKLFWPLSFQVIYIDGNHSYEAVLADSGFCWPLVAPGGFVIWDDWRNRHNLTPGVAQALREILPQLPKPWKLVWKNKQFAIQKGAA